MTVTTLQTLRSEPNYKLFWQKFNVLRTSFDAEDPKLSGKGRGLKELLKELLLMIVSHILIPSTMNL